MRGRFFFLVGVLALSACAGGGNSRYSRPAVITPQILDCGPAGLANIRVWSPAEAQLSFRGRRHDLTRDPNSSGAYYRNKNIEYANRGVFAIIRQDKTNYRCDFRPRDLEPEPPMPYNDSAPYSAPYPAPQPSPVDQPVPRLDVTPYL